MLSASKLNRKSDDDFEDHFPYPTCWHDNARRQLLLSPFRERDLNPEGFDSKLKFWVDLIEKYCIYKGDASFSKSELKSRFTRNDRVPSCLDIVLSHMEKQKIVCDRRDYEFDRNSTWTGWAAYKLIKKPVLWAFEILKSNVVANKTSESHPVEYVHLNVLKNFCKQLHEILKKPPFLGKVQPYEVFATDVLKVMLLSDSCIKLCTEALHYERKISLSYKRTYNENSIYLIKVPADENELDIRITEGDLAMHNMSVIRMNLMGQLKDIEIKIEESTEKIRQYLQQNKRQMAKYQLRSKHLLERNYEKQSLALYNIEALLSSVEEAKHNNIILDAYKYGSKALHDILDASNLKYDNATEIISEVTETIETHKELEDAIGNANLNILASNEDDELERELAQLIKEENSKTDSKSVPVPSNIDTIKFQTMPVTDELVTHMLEKLEVEQESPSKKSEKLLQLNS
uniref:Charged multivesicular body protein 7 n=1 Tax=Glossina brevipalpis TaxID=37001 RepID=A0A1A9WBN6_9MUSC